MQKYVVLIIVFLLVFAVAVGGLIYVIRSGQEPVSEEVALALEAPEDVTSGDAVTFAVRWHNRTRVPLQAAEVFFRYPDGTIPREKPDQLVASVAIGTIPPGGGRFYRVYGICDW